MSTPYISIVMPCYNAASTVAATLACFTHEFESVPDCDYEIIVVNDGSTDTSKDVVIKSSENNPRIKYYEKKNSGVSDTRNFGLSKATGEYVWDFDADDLVFEGSIKRLITMLRDTNADIMQFNSITEDHTNAGSVAAHNNAVTAKVVFEGPYQDFLAGGAKVGFSSCTMIVRRDMLVARGARFMSGMSISEDVLWNVFLAWKCPEAKFVRTDLCVLRYIVRGNSAVNTADHQKNYRQLLSSFELYDQLDAISPVPTYLAESIYAWRNRAVIQSITRLLSCKLSREENRQAIGRIRSMIISTGVEGRIVSAFNVFSKSTMLTSICQMLYRNIFLTYVKPRMGRN